MTKVYYCDTKRWSDIMTEQERSLPISTRPRLSRTTRKAKSVWATAFQAREY